MMLVSLACFAGSISAENWPRFHGPGGQGISSESSLPVKWSATTNVRWKTPLPGPGHSSPIVWGDRIFVTAFRRDDSLLSFLRAGGELLVLSIDASSGKILWERKVPAGRIEETHSTNAPASPTPVTDGQRVYVYFGSFGLTCFDFQGNKIWEHPLGPFPNEWGSASSPVLYGDLLLLNVDTDADDFLLAVNKHTGQTVWKTSRSNVTRAWPTPAIWNANGKDEIVVSGSGQVKAYDPKDGRELWTVDGLTRWVTPTPVTAHSLLYVACNGPGGNLIMAIRPGGRGNITGTHVAWRYNRAAPYSSSPVVVGDYLYAVKNGGVMSCLNAKTGELVWQERLPARGDYFASLVAGDAKIYALSEDGQATVVAAKPSFELVSSNDMGERCMASPAVSGGRIFIRTDESLYCIVGPGR
ncbi:MAG: PQQ-like beta-propeller repeat protein [Acidobacteria bacterium]|nr:PQQ-like beta-propeller repeat protein [Acidobacteriota bacterium]